MTKKNPTTEKNLPSDCDPENKSETPNNKAESEEFTLDPQDHQQTPQTMPEESEINPTANESKWRYTPFNQTTNELVAAHSQRMRIPT